MTSVKGARRLSMRSIQKIANVKYNQSKPLFQVILAVHKNETQSFGGHCGMVLVATRSTTLVHRGKRDYPYQSYLRLSLRHGFSRNPEDFAIHVYMGHDLRHDALVIQSIR